MSDQEFKAELIRHIRAIVVACIRRFGWSWADFQPKDKPGDLTRTNQETNAPLTTPY